MQNWLDRLKKLKEKIDSQQFISPKQKMYRSKIFIIDRNLATIAAMLKCKPENLVMLAHRNALECKYGASPFKDKLVEQKGLNGLPYLYTSKDKKTPADGQGIRKYYDAEAGVEYVMLSSSEFDIVFLRKGEIFKYSRHVRRKNLLYAQLQQPKMPILAEGIVEQVIKNSVNIFKNKKMLSKYLSNVKKGIILSGPPGNGKTMLCRYIKDVCKQNSIPVSTINSSDLNSAYNDSELESLICKEGVLFFDDIDTSYMNRADGGKIASALLTAMDGVESSKNCTVRIFTTNEKIGNIEEAFRRPGRIDCCIELEKPDFELRLKYINTWEEDILNSFDPEKLAQDSDEFSFAQLALVKSLLVMNYLENGKWDIDKAVDDFDMRNSEVKHHVGFVTAV